MPTCNVNGNTTITAPLTLGASSQVDIDAGFTSMPTAPRLTPESSSTAWEPLIRGRRTPSPPIRRSIRTSSISTPGSWIVEAGAELDVQRRRLRHDGDQCLRRHDHAQQRRHHRKHGRCRVRHGRRAQHERSGGLSCGRLDRRTRRHRQRRRRARRRRQCHRRRQSNSQVGSCAGRFQFRRRRQRGGRGDVAFLTVAR